VKIAVLGTGGVGAALGARWSAAGHAVIFGSRTPHSDRVRQLVARSGPSAAVMAPRDAVGEADATLLAVPWPAARSALAEAGDLSGQLLIDCTNPLLSDLSGIEVGHLTSAAEQIAAWSPGARVVKAFNTASTKVMLDPRFGEQQATMFYCGDDAAAKGIVKRLIADVGFEPVDAGPLISARYLEPLAMLYIHLAYQQGWSSDCAFKIIKR
jgi:predicted dinucleotide-binding enzyme